MSRCKNAGSVDRHMISVQNRRICARVRRNDFFLASQASLSVFLVLQSHRPKIIWFPQFMETASRLFNAISCLVFFYQFMYLHISTHTHKSVWFKIFEHKVDVSNLRLLTQSMLQEFLPGWKLNCLRKHLRQRQPKYGLAK